MSQDPPGGERSPQAIGPDPEGGAHPEPRQHRLARHCSGIAIRIFNAGVRLRTRAGFVKQSEIPALYHHDDSFGGGVIRLCASSCANYSVR